MMVCLLGGSSEVGCAMMVVGGVDVAGGAEILFGVMMDFTCIFEFNN